MLALWSAADLLDGKLVAERGPLLAAPDCIALATSVQTTPATWARPLDPADLSPYAYSFASLLLPDETITHVHEIAVSAVGREVGVIVHASGGYVPTIAGEKADHVQVWPGVEERFWQEASYDAGLQFAIRFRVGTSLSPTRRLERRAIMTALQL